MNRRTMLVSGTAVWAAVAFGAHAGPHITTDIANGASFATYKTFGWVAAPMPAGMDPVAYQNLLQDVEGAMASKGYTKADAPDLALLLTLGARDKTEVNSFGFWGLRTDVWQYTEGKLSLDAFDAKTKQAVWHGQATETIDRDKPRPAKIADAIQKLMAKFPTSGAA